MPSSPIEFAAFRMSHYGAATRWPEEMFQLEHDPRMEAAWRSLARVSKEPETFSVVLRALFGLKVIAERAESFAAAHKRLPLDRERVVGASSEMVAFLLSVSRGDGETGYALLKNRTAVQAEAQHHLGNVARALAFTIKTMDEAERRLSLIASTSQKTTRQVAFSNLLCRFLCRKVGQPLHQFVATTTSVLFDLDEDVTVEAVRMAYDRDIKRRGKVAPSPRTVPAGQ